MSTRHCLVAILVFALGCGPGETEIHHQEDARLGPTGDAGTDVLDVTGSATDAHDAPSADVSLDDATATDLPAQNTFAFQNLDSGETLRYPLALIVGTVDSNASEVFVTDVETRRSWPLVDGQFRALARLGEGSQSIEFSAGNQRASLELTYTPQSASRFVRLVYVVASDGSGEFQAPAGEPNDIESAHKRIALGGELMQTFVAESMNSEGYGRRTFRLARTPEGKPLVKTVTSDLTTAEAHAMTGGELYNAIDDELDSYILSDSSKDVAFMAFSRYDPDTGDLKAHTALGGGRLGLFGTSSMHTWAEDLDGLVEAWTDETPIDTSMLHDDSNSRGTHWANYATTLGVALHELSHAMSLPHPMSSQSFIMFRGFDHFNRMFLVSEPASDTTPAMSPIPDDAIPGWHDGNAARLRYHRWFEMDAIVHDSDEPPVFDLSGDTLTVKSVNGLRQIGYSIDGTLVDFDAWHATPAQRHEIDLPSVKSQFGTGSLRARAIDDHGNISERNNIDL